MTTANKRPPPQNLLTRIAAAKAEVAKRVAERKAAWSFEGQAPGGLIFRAWAFHQQVFLWRQALAELRALETELSRAEGEAR